MKKTYFLMTLIVLTVAFMSLIANANYVDRYEKYEPYYHERYVEELDYDAEAVAAYRYAYDKGITSASVRRHGTMASTGLTVSSDISRFALHTRVVRTRRTSLCGFVMESLRPCLLNSRARLLCGP